MSLQGDLETLPAEDLAQTLAQRGSTGTLVVQQGHLEHKFFFDQGRIAGSASSDPRQRLGTFLVNEGLLDQATLDHAMRLSRETCIHLGQVLVTLGVLGEPELNRVIKLKVERAFSLLLSNREGRFEFLEHERPRSSMVPTSLNVAGVVLAGGLRADEECGGRTPVEAVPCVDRPVPSPTPGPSGGGAKAAVQPHAMTVRTPPARAPALAPPASESRAIGRPRAPEVRSRLGILDRRRAPLALAGLLLLLIVALVADLPGRIDRSAADSGETASTSASLAALPVGSILGAPSAGTALETPAVDALEGEASPEAETDVTLESEAGPAPEPEVLEQVRGLVDSRVAEIERSVEAKYQAKLATLQQQLETVRREMKDGQKPRDVVAGALPGAAGPANQTSVAEVEAAARGGNAALSSDSRPVGGDSAPASATESRDGEILGDPSAEAVVARDLVPAPAAGDSEPAVGSQSESSATRPESSVEPPAELSASRVVVGPKILDKPQPSYPRAAKAMRIEGKVVLRVLVAPSGRVLEIEQLSKPLGRGFDDTAREAARRSRWEPGRVNGEAEAMWAELHFDFRLSE